MSEGLRCHIVSRRDFTVERTTESAQFAKVDRLQFLYQVSLAREPPGMDIVSFEAAVLEVLVRLLARFLCTELRHEVVREEVGAGITGGDEGILIVVVCLH